MYSCATYCQFSNQILQQAPEPFFWIKYSTKQHKQAFFQFMFYISWKTFFHKALVIHYFSSLFLSIGIEQDQELENHDITKMAHVTRTPVYINNQWLQ